MATKNKTSQGNKGKGKDGGTTQYRPPKEHIVSRASIKRTWGIRPPQEWLSLLKEIAPANDWKMKGQSRIMGKCPYHDDSTPSFTLSFDKGMGKCYGAGCEKLVTDIINLVAKLRNCSYVEALLFVYNRFNLGDTISSKANEFSRYNETQEVKKAAAIAMSKIVQDVLKDCPDYLEYCIPAVHYLTHVRKVPEAVLPLMPVGVFAKPVHMKKYIPITMHAAYDMYFKDLESDTYYGCLCFHYNDSPGSISRFKLRHKNQMLLGKLKSFPDFVNLSGIEKAQLFSKGSSHYLDDPYTGEIGAFGLHRYQSMIGKNDTNAYVTEGEFDALSVMAAQFNTGNVNFMIFAIGGKGATNVSFLREYGIRTVWLVPDHPTKQGDSWAESVLINKANFTSSLGQTPLQFRVFQWPPGMQGGDLDEAVLLQGYPLIQDYLQKSRNLHFLNSVAWICQQTDASLELVDQEYDTKITLMESENEERKVELSNIEDQRRSALQDAILVGFRLVHLTFDKQEFARKYTESRGIDITIIEAIHTSVYALDTTQGVVDKVLHSLNEYFELAYYVRRSGDTTIYAWAKKSEELVEIPTNERALLKTIALYVNQEIEQWFDSMLGENVIYYDGITPGDNSLTASRKKRLNSRIIVEKAFEQMMAHLQNYDSMQILSQGIHYLDLPDELRRKGYIYFVNGKKVFRGQFKNEGEVEWVRINNVVDKGVIFEDVTTSQKWSFVEDVADLYEAPLIDLNNLFDQICKILNGWVFKDHKITVQYLASYIMSITVMRAMSDINITLFTGETTSGKTTFASGLLSGSGAKKSACPHILESVFQMEDTTLPALYQSMEGKSHLVVLDEAESGEGFKTKKDENFQAVLGMARSMPMGGSLIHRGGKEKSSRKSYFMKFPLFLAAINMPTSAVFLSRTIIISTMRHMDHLPVEQYLDENFTTQEIEDIRKNVTLSLIPHVPQLMALRKKLGETLLKEGRKVAKVSNRFLDCILTPLTVYEFLGRDSKKLYTDILKANKGKLENIHNQDSQNDIINTCLYTGHIKMTSLDNMVDFVSAKSLIINRDFTFLNNSDCGVYCIDEANWIVIVWRQAKYGVLSHGKFGQMEEGSLKDAAQRNPFAKDDVSEEDHAIVQRYLNLMDVKSKNDYSIISLEYLMGVTFEEGVGFVSPEETEVADFLESKEEVKEEKVATPKPESVTVTPPVTPTSHPTRKIRRRRVGKSIMSQTPAQKKEAVDHKIALEKELLKALQESDDSILSDLEL